MSSRISFHHLPVIPLLFAVQLLNTPVVIIPPSHCLYLNVALPLSSQNFDHLSEFFLQALYMNRLHKKRIHCLTDCKTFHYVVNNILPSSKLQVEKYYILSSVLQQNNFFKTHLALAEQLASELLI